MAHLSEEELDREGQKMMELFDKLAATGVKVKICLL
jgi:hypothetical protein